MRVINCSRNIHSKSEYLYNNLSIDINEKKIISFVGAGGKTTLIYYLAEELKAFGKKVIITTTTNMFIPPKYFLYSKNLMHIKEKLNQDGIVVLGKPAGDNKFTFLDYEIYDKLPLICDFLLIECDGSRRLPLKAPDKHEPVILDKCDIVVGVAGIDAVDKKVKDTCHRKEIVCNILNVEQSHIVTENDIAVLLSSDKGQMKYVNSFNKNIEYIAVINKCDTDELVKKAEKAAEFLREKNIDVILTSFHTEYN